MKSERDQQLYDLIRKARQYKNNESCLTCSHFELDKFRCVKAPEREIPLKILAYSCPSYDYDDIPF